MNIKVGDVVKFGQFSRGVVVKVSDEPRKCLRADGRWTTATAAMVSFDGPRNTQWVAVRDLEVQP